MKYLLQFSIVLGVYWIGNLIAPYIPFPLPGSICGMLILLALLCLKIIKLEWVEDCSNVFFKYLAFFFVPSGVALMNSMDLIKANLTAFLVIGVVVTLIVQIVTGVTLQKILGGKES